MSAQTSYSINTEGAFAGQLRDINPQTRVSYLAEGGDIPFGVAVSQGTADNQAVIAGAVAGFLGITVRDLAHEGAPVTGVIEYKEMDTMSILQKGYIYAACVDGCSPGDPVDYNVTTGVLTTGGGGQLIPGAKWKSTTAATEIGIIHLDVV